GTEDLSVIGWSRGTTICQGITPRQAIVVGAVGVICVDGIASVVVVPISRFEFLVLLGVRVVHLQTTLQLLTSVITPDRKNRHPISIVIVLFSYTSHMVSFPAFIRITTF